MKAPEKFRITLTGTTIDILARGNAGAKVDHYVGQLLNGTELPDSVFRPWYLGVALAEAPDVMGPVNIHTLARQGAFVEIICDHCGRRAVFEAGPLSSLARDTTLQTDLRDMGRQMRCEAKRGGCGKRGATVRPTDYRRDR